MQIFLAECPVIEISPTFITIDLGTGVHIHIPTTHFPDHQIKRGAIIPLFTEIPNAQLSPASKQ